MLLRDSTDIPRYLMDSFERTLMRGDDTSAVDTSDIKYDLELPSLMQGIQLAQTNGEGATTEAIRKYIINDDVD